MKNKPDADKIKQDFEALGSACATVIEGLAEGVVRLAEVLALPFVELKKANQAKKMERRKRVCDARRRRNQLFRKTGMQKHTLI